MGTEEARVVAMVGMVWRMEVSQIKATVNHRKISILAIRRNFFQKQGKRTTQEDKIGKEQARALNQHQFADKGGYKWVREYCG